MTSATQRLRARAQRPRVAHAERRAHVDGARRASAPTRAWRSSFGSRHRRLPDAARLPGRPAAPRTCCARATAAGRGGRSGSPPARSRAPRASSARRATKSYALTSTPAAGSSMFRSLFTTSTGGDAGSASRLTLSASRADDHPAPAAPGQPPDHGQRRRCAGAQGGEQIVVSARPAGSTELERAGRHGRRQRRPLHRGVPRDAARTQFVARWAGDSGRQGAGSPVLTVRVRR